MDTNQLYVFIMNKFVPLWYKQHDVQYQLTTIKLSTNNEIIKLIPKENPFMTINWSINNNTQGI